MRVMTGLGRLVIGTLLAGALVAGLLLPYTLGLGMASNKVATAVQGAEAAALDEPVPLTTTFTDSQGTPIAYVYNQNRVQRPLAGISDYLQKAVVAVEDRRFFTHNGVDWRGTVRALLVNAQGDQGPQGGSTLTQQYVKNYLYLVQAKTEAEKADAIAATPIRKLREARMALALEAQLNSKDAILERYLNLVAFGPSTYGAEAASKRYFGVDADQLTLPQAALLAGMVNNPNKFNPLNPDRIEDAKKRRDTVLTLMAQQKWISPQAADEAKAADLGLNPQTVPNGCVAAPNSETDGFFCTYVTDYLAGVGLDYDTVASAGYTVKTTLDPTVMAAAKAATTSNADPNDPAVARIANVTAVVQKGEPRKVAALASNRPFGLNAEAGQTVQKLTTTFAPLGAGSTFKIFTAAAALEAGWGTNNVVDVPAEYPSTINPGSITRNAGTFPTRMTIAQALATSPNTAFVNLEESVGLGKVAEMAVRLGMKGYLLDAGEVVPSFAGTGTDYEQQITAQKIASFTLGVSPVSPLELANVGATIASDGRWCPPTPVDTITDRDGRLVAWNSIPCEEAVPKELARTLAVAMEGDLENVNGTKGTAFDAASAAGWNFTAAGKTGTTQTYRSSAFLGFTPQTSASVLVWDYLPQPQSICRDPLRSCSEDEALQAGNGMSGGSVPAQTWFSMMNPLVQGAEPQLFAPASSTYITGSQATQVPNVVGRPLEDATAELTSRGFLVATSSKQGTGAVANVVVGQTPTGNAPAGSTINLTISAGGAN
ncbi:penicillin-binding protein [Nakamurella flavida]|uniref:Penicillin-binding protein n=2 Tax=Nakamurella flavida TaxID=363630 RepID=A0A939C501_9ACTN|nr:penicillin-binding protein [Nakamurella flavida]MDP9779621.1 membrane peptidoglycan carboxypeptidase [Nakamurella flavida]